MILTHSKQFCRKYRLLKRQYIKQQIELLEAAYSNGYAFAKLRLEVGAYITQFNPRPKSKALVYATDYGNREMVELLRDSGNHQMTCQP